MFVRFSACVCWLVFLTSWFLNTVRVVFRFYLMKSARCKGRNVVLSFSLINIRVLRLLYLLKFYLPLILPEEQMDFKHLIQAIQQRFAVKKIKHGSHSCLCVLLKVDTFTCYNFGIELPCFT